MIKIHIMNTIKYENVIIDNKKYFYYFMGIFRIILIIIFYKEILFIKKN